MEREFGAGMIAEANMAKSRVGMRNCGRVLPGVERVMKDLGEPNTVFHLGEDEGAVATHEARVAVHDFEVGANGLGKIGFVDNEEVGLGNAGASFTGNFVSASDIDDVDSVISEFTTEMGGQVVATGFEQEQVRLKALVEFLEGQEIGGDIFADGSMRAAAGLNGADAFRRQCLVTNQEFTVLASEDVVGDGGNVHAVPQFPAEREHEGSFAAANRAADADRKGTMGQVTMKRLIAVMEMSWVRQMFVGVSVAVVRVVVVRVRVHVKS
jgi:hypothetical protein